MTALAVLTCVGVLLTLALVLRLNLGGTRLATTAGGLPYPGTGDAPNGPAAVQSLAVAIDNTVKMAVPNAAARTALSGISTGLIVVEKDTGSTYVKTASGWLQLNTVTADTGWIDLTLAAGWTKSFARYRVRNGIYYFTIAATRTSWSQDTTLFTIASTSNRPAFQHSFTGMWSGVAKEVKAQTSGTVVMAGSSGSTGVAVAGSWPI